ncbi:MAG: low specificity L-threonine aldolase [Hoeflea sp.]|uniref:threonine aldolase family protein n=1 Tax=Hoeflea sp. TaxID=1940281 RepID=UPI001E1602D8|nr:low specificity L-threonine aldolase [Hoeflea sp.]MBU4528225.1 low specificity L-threonine aldolase [Alphaproteobacteria bacterium]MBU4543821.1 low specificity L-threonine aldolase [Alphaproteobacteria bacterium]MBU4548462.1 low specificity L-threonine aldolase [Alphaproteobacteria bacterium]MBV1722541.1 low specificity L-threonine aldolase [Hoeflea sp.]MBV1762210.1 low specificity L-threonine aldolase [Hoeflea sp.]
MIFTSDNWAGAHPAVAASLSAHSTGFAPAYGASDLDRKVEAKFNEIFERDVAVFFVGTGTAANSLALSAINRPGGVSFCHREAHVIADECGAPEFFSHGSRLVPVDGADGKMDPGNLEREIARFPAGFVHAGQPMAITLTQATEAGTVYTAEEIRTLSTIARAHGLPLHMDGARFANALVALDLTPAQMTHELGVDIVSFGGTKNGCWCAEALVFLDPAMAVQAPFIRKRAAQLFSKSRFIAAQFDAYFENDLWLDVARHANAMAARLQAGIENSSKARLAWQSPANETFPIVLKSLAKDLSGKGALFYEWAPPRSATHLVGEDETMLRLVTSFATTEEHVDQFVDLLR